MNGDLVQRVSEAVQFPGGYLPAAYLNDENLQKAFVAEVGEVKKLIAEVTRGHDIGGEGGPWFAKLTGKVTRAGGGQVELTLEEAATLALVCRAVATRQGRVADPCQPVQSGHYVEVSGRALFVHPDVVLPGSITEGVRHLLDITSDRDVEELRTHQETQEYATQVPPGRGYAVGIEANCAVASVLNERWIRKGIMLRFNGQQARIFGQIQRRFERPRPIVVVAPLAIWMYPPS
jgi:hypothetical protein